MIGIVSAIYASFFLALSQGALKKSFRDLEPSVGFFFDAMFGLLLWIPLSLFFGIRMDNILNALPYAILSAVLSEALYFYALSKGQLSITSILLGSYPVYTILLSYIINNERLQSNQLFFIILTITGTLLTYLPSKLNRTELGKTGALLWPLVAAIGVGLSDAMSKKIINQTMDFSFLFTLALVQIPIALVYLRIERQGATRLLVHVKEHMAIYKQAIAGSALNIIGTGLLWVSFSYTLASIASPITATSGAIVVLLAIIFLDEHINVRSLLGLLLVFLGIMGIAMTY